MKKTFPLRVRRLIAASSRAKQQVARFNRALWSERISAVANVAIAAAAVTGIGTWVAERHDRELSRKVQKAELVQWLRQDIEKNKNQNEFPSLKFTLGGTIQSLSDLGEPVRIYGDDITIEGANIRCARDVIIYANKLKFANARLIDSDIKTTAPHVTFESSLLSDASITQDINEETNGSSFVTTDSKFLGRTYVRTQALDVRLAGLLSEGTIFADSNMEITNSFFVYNLPFNHSSQFLSGQSKRPEDYVGTTFARTGAYLSNDGFSLLGVSLERTGKRIDEIMYAQRGEPRPHDGLNEQFRNLCVYSEDKDIQNSADCPPLAMISSEILQSVVRRPVGLEHYFISPNFFEPKEGHQYTQIYEPKYLPIRDHFKSYIPGSINGFALLTKEDMAPCEN